MQSAYTLMHQQTADRSSTKNGEINYSFFTQFDDIVPGLCCLLKELGTSFGVVGEGFNSYTTVDLNQ